ncbi:AAA family ATPase [Sphingobium chungbukense]|uniref:Pilus assembly protein CpaE n=1 Tax=Sphingobium chungbukense TaxID=56193 RepID=A0A0M3ASP0_9SPHN|nr:pilus assembly protein CpaE [Sphingobium chungbukense]KKW92913.1 pilus assembly protein CpaE [Sphingobium chungbukense]PJG46968.1 pilus assembly protein CpaE [Sphingobium sp. LB126]
MRNKNLGIVTNAAEPAESWTLNIGDEGIHLILSEQEVQASDILGDGLSGQSLTLSMLPSAAALPSQMVAEARAIILEVEPDSDASMKRLIALRAANPKLRLVAAIRDAQIPVVRALLRSGINDVVALPLQASELTSILDELRAAIAADTGSEVKTGQLVSIIKSVGGVGATTVATQAASLHARSARQEGSEVCLFDFDIQFGNAGTFMGISSPLTLADLLTGGNRVDQELLRTVTVETATGLRVVTAPPEIMPIEAVNADQVFRVVELAQRSFDTVYLDLPGNWTNWSMSLVARSQVIFLVVELTIASLRQARRQIALLRSQDIDPSRIHVIANRVEKKFFRAIGLEDAAAALDHPVSLSIANDFPLVSSALDQGVLIQELKARSRVCKDLQDIVDCCVQAAEAERRAEKG